jgi:hypothetical protein
MSGDTYYNDVALLLHMDGANGSTTFTDNSPSPKTVTANGNAQVSTTQSKFGGASSYFNGTGDYLSIPYSSDFNFESSNFTIECWLYRTGVNANGHRIYNSGGDLYGQVDIFINASGFLECYGTTNGNDWNAWASTSIALIPLNAWTHIAIVRNVGTVTAYVDGIGTTLTSSLGTSTLANGTGAASTRTIGGQPGTNRSYLGYIDEYRITKGIARYTSNFTPSAAAFPNGPVINALFQDNGPLGNANVLAILDVDALLSDAGPLGQPSIVGNHLFAFASAPSVLGPELALAFHLFARADVPSMLGAANPLAVHDFTGQLGDATTYYVMDLTTPSGTVRVPISSWQATLQTGLSNYVQCVVPAAQSYVTQINAATQFKILRQVTLPSGFVIEYQMASGPVQTVTLDQGPFRYTATIAGYSSGFAINETPSPAYNRTMSGLRSVSVSEGKARVRCSIDWLLRPAQRVFAGDRNFIVSYINYYVGNNDAYMEVGER